MKRVIHLSVITMIISLILSACGTANPFIGKWETGEEKEYLEFKKDMTFWAIKEDREPNEVYLLGTYSIDGDTVTMIFTTGQAGKPMAAGVFEVREGGDLILIHTPDGKVSSLQKAE
jgi:hypothetical protein